ncbi:NAD(P)-binding protein [Nonomuraea lactucae]|uniref:NAD(P)-binding protein n=1 Tax=Nonomuraea lactucae TaxID=2249762 RepID=UPI001F05CB6F|nr:NAD(P)-binding protein [Nonomuraea lactucae]
MSDIDPRLARDLGMRRPISRRDFFDGVAVAAGAAAAGAVAGQPPVRSASHGTGEGPEEAVFPPRLTGLRGNTADALSVPHALRDGRFWDFAGDAEPTGENYDLVVVGGGLSGVSAACEWLRHEPRARVLILDNHDEIGGHARRVEFRPAGRPGPLIGQGGSRSIDSPSVWTPEGKDLLDRLGIVTRTLRGYHDEGLYPGLGLHEGVMCDRETFALDTLVRFAPGTPPERWVNRLPVADQARRDLLRLWADPPDWFPELSREEKEERLAGLTYSAFLLDVCGAHPEVERFYRTAPSARWGYDTRSFGAIDAWGSGDYPGFQGLGLDAGKPSRFCSPTLKKEWGAPDREDLHCFPEGVQALVRIMVGRMIPGFATSASPGADGSATAATMDGVTTAAYDYGRLDHPANRVRFRLSSPVVSVRNDGDPGSASTATVAYFDGHRVRTVRAGSVVLACWNAVIPYLVPDLPGQQVRALREAVKTPMLEATVQVRDWRAWRRAGVHRTRWTGAYWCLAELDHPLSTPGYECPKDPGEPINVHLVATPCRSELGPVRGAVAGRRALLRTPYNHLEYTVRDQLARLLGSAGFDPAADIEAITVNRWGHGYAPEYCRPWYGFYPDGPFPADAARRPFGRIAIANSDSVPAARADAAITAAYRAVADLRDEHH